MNSPKGYHSIKVHLVFAVKCDGRHKARFMADGHLSPEPIENIYSGKLNNQDQWGADIGNVYLEAFTDEKLYQQKMMHNSLSRLLVRLLLSVDLQWTYCYKTINVSID